MQDDVLANSNPLATAPLISFVFSYKTVHTRIWSKSHYTRTYISERLVWCETLKLWPWERTGDSSAADCSVCYKYPINEKTAKCMQSEAGGRDTSDGRADFLSKPRFPAASKTVRAFPIDEAFIVCPHLRSDSFGRSQAQLEGRGCNLVKNSTRPDPTVNNFNPTRH